MKLNEASRIPMTEEEEALVNEIIAHHGVAQASLTRRDPGETGPVVVHIAGKTYEVDGGKVGERHYAAEVAPTHRAAPETEA